MDYAEYSKLKSEAVSFIRSTGKFKTPNNITNRDEEWYGNGMIIYFDSAASDDRIIAFLDKEGDTHYLNLSGLEEKLKEQEE